MSKIKDYSYFYSKISKRRKPNLIRHMTEKYMLNGQKGIFFASGMPNARMFPFQKIAVTYSDGTSRELIDRDLLTALQYGPTKGYPPLVNKWKELIRRWHSPKYEEWDVQVSTGSQDGCSKIFEMILDEGDPVMVQSPMYPGFLNGLVPMNADCISIGMDEDGILPEYIVDVFDSRQAANQPLPKLLYVNPVGANPTGTVYSQERKQQIYNLAQKYNFLILEDDAYYFLHFLDKQPISFLSLDTDGRVIRSDSFSKVMSGGLRVGILTGHSELLEKVMHHEQSTILHTSSLSQVLIHELFEAWSYDKLMDHFSNVRQFYLDKRNIAVSLVSKYFKGIAEWSIPKGGMFIWIRIIVVDDVYKIAMEECLPRGFYVLPGHVFDVDNLKYKQYIRVCYSQVTLEDMDKGLSEIARIIRENATKGD